MIIVMMGVAGSGKTYIGTLLAARLGIPFADGDDYHSVENKMKMASGHPLNDEDRWPWLKKLSLLLRTWSETGKGGVLACSALRESYRQALAEGLPVGEPRFVWLDTPVELLEERLANRHHEYMNPGLLGSQIATLEVPSNALRIVNDQDPDVIVDMIVGALTASH